jgi:hypothetical protein
MKSDLTKLQRFFLDQTFLLPTVEFLFLKRYRKDVQHLFRSLF